MSNRRILAIISSVAIRPRRIAFGLANHIADRHVGLACGLVLSCCCLLPRSLLSLHGGLGCAGRGRKRLSGTMHWRRRRYGAGLLSLRRWLLRPGCRLLGLLRFLLRLRRRRWPTGTSHGLQLLDRLLIGRRILGLGRMILIRDNVGGLWRLLHQVRRHVQIHILWRFFRHLRHCVHNRGGPKHFQLGTVENLPEDKERKDQRNPNGFPYAGRQPLPLQSVDDIEQLMR